MASAVRPVIVVALLLAKSLISLSQDKLSDSDVILKKSLTVVIEEERDGTCTAASDVLVEMKLLSERSTKRDKLIIVEPFYSHISKLNVKCNRVSIPSDDISYSIVDRKDAFLSDSKMYTATLPSTLHRGDIVSYSYRQTYSELAFLPILHVPS